MRPESLSTILRDSGLACRMAAENGPVIEGLNRLAAALATALRAGHKLLICGNGGSAAEAQHIAAELVGVLDRDRPRCALAAIALTTDSSILTAIGNDMGYDQVFARQVEALGQAGDVFIGLTTSGRSPNVLAAARAAAARGLDVTLWAGPRGAPDTPGRCIAVPFPDAATGPIQVAHLAMGHALVRLVEALLEMTP